MSMSRPFDRRGPRRPVDWQQVGDWLRRLPVLVAGLLLAADSDLFRLLKGIE